MARDRFPMRIALIVLGSMFLVSALFALIVRVLGDDPSHVMVAGVLLVLALVSEGVARQVQRATGLAFLAGIIGVFAGLPLGGTVVMMLPNEFDAASGALWALIAAAWSASWYRRTRTGLPIAAVIVESAAFIGFLGEWADLSSETIGIVFCLVGIAAAVAAILGRLAPGLSPLVASLVVIGYGCITQNTYGGDIAASVGVVISAGLFVLAYRRSDAVMSTATAVATGIWAVVLTTALTSGAIAPLIVAAAVGAALVLWGQRRGMRGD
ncbi:MAG: hypothetical protein ACKOZX_09755 [Gammaproteobacteria bacterium]